MNTAIIIGVESCVIDSTGMMTRTITYDSWGRRVIKQTFTPGDFEMSIKGLTDKGAAFPRIGELRKGDVKPETGNRPGKDLDYFRFTSDDPATVTAFATAYGSQPRVIRCYLPYRDVESNFQTFMEEWLKGGLVRRCDGENILVERNSKGTYDSTPHRCMHTCHCKQVGRLSVIVPELRRFAYVLALTSSTWDIVELHSNLTAVFELTGDLRGIPFILSRKLREVSVPDDKGGRVRREKWLLSIEAAPTWVQAKIDQLPQFVEPAQLPAPDEDGVIEAATTSTTTNAQKLGRVDADGVIDDETKGDKRTDAKARIEKHGKRAREIVSALSQAGYEEPAREVERHINDATVIYKNSSSTIAELHKAADRLKEANANAEKLLAPQPA